MEKIKSGLAVLPLTDISIGKTNPRPPEDLTPESLKELTASIKEKGVIQAIVVRPFKDKYQLVCGERRYQSSKLAEQKDIPCSVRELTDDEAYELQIIENLERKDVHPLHEAAAFKKLLDTKRYTIPDLAAKFAKQEHYIVARLKLNDLSGDFKKDFFSGEMSIGHAVLAARLTEENQKELNNSLKHNFHKYGNVSDFNKTIQKNITNQLSGAPFRKDDAELIPAAGACTTCPKRSGGNTLLFHDIKEKDRCFDKACFVKKIETFTLNKLKEVIENNPDIIILEYPYGKDPDKILVQYCKDYHMKIIEQFNDFDIATPKAKGAIKGYWINGERMGQIDSIVLKKEVKNISKTGKVTDESIKADIQAINDREKRAKELDSEKVHTLIKSSIKADEKYITDSPINTTESKAIIIMLYDLCGWGETRKFIDKELKTNNEYNRFNIYKKLQSKTPNEIGGLMAKVIRTAILDKLCGTSDDPNKNGAAAIIRQIAIERMPEAVKQHDEDQQVKADKRIGRVNQRIADLEAQKKELKAPAKKKEATPNKGGIKKLISAKK